MAALLGKKLEQIDNVKVDFESLQTNMVNFNITKPNFNHNGYKKYLHANGIKIKAYNEDLQLYRLVTYPQIR
jgi:threonine aldolase